MSVMIVYLENVHTSVRAFLSTGSQIRLFLGIFIQK
jgi:hypothetical protein